MNSDFSDFIRFFPIFRLFPTFRLLDSTTLVPTMHHWILLACHYFSGLTVRSPIGFELDMMLPPSQLEMPSHQEKGIAH